MYRKYHNTKTVVDDMVFDSKAEARRWQQLRLMERGGIIRDLRRQVPYVLIKSFRWPSGKACPKTVYKADFVYVIEGTGEVVVEDVKGVLTPEYKLKKKLMMEKYGIEVKEVKA